MFITTVIKTPFSDIATALESAQDHPVCAEFELRMANCLDAYGLHRGIDKCHLYIHDLYECMAQTKRVWRYKEMHRERVKTVLTTGEARPYLPVPPGDLF